MAIKNYTTKIPALQTVGEIQGILACHGARKIMLDYTAEGRVSGITFSIETEYGSRVFIIPARVEQVQAVLVKQKVKCDFNHAENVAWRIIKDWLDAQMAFLESEQVAMDEIFLPYMTNGKETLYELVNKNNILALEEKC